MDRLHVNGIFIFHELGMQDTRGHSCGLCNLVPGKFGGKLKANVALPLMDTLILGVNIFGKRRFGFGILEITYSVYISAMIGT